MLMWIIIIALLLIGLALVILEVIFIPGTTVVGLLGLIFTIVGIVICYQHFGDQVGFYVLLGSGAITLGALVISFRSGAWTRFSLKDTSEGRFNDGLSANLAVGDEGITTSALRPMGKAEFAEKNYEVKTTGAYLAAGVPVKIAAIAGNQIIVEPIINQ